MKKTWTAALLGLSLLAASAAQAAPPAFMKIVGSKGGQVKGSVADRTYDNWIRVTEATHEIKQPYDPATGLPNGNAQNGTFVVRKEVDMATVPLRSILANNELLSSVEIAFMSRGPQGPVNNYSVKLMNARLVSMRTELPDVTDPEGSKAEMRDELQFVYERIEWTWKPNGIIGVGFWSSRP